MQPITLYKIICSLILCLMASSASWSQQGPADAQTEYDSIFHNVDEEESYYDDETYYDEDPYQEEQYIYEPSFNDVAQNPDYYQRKITAADWDKLKQNPEYNYKTKEIEKTDSSNQSNSEPTSLLKFFAKIFDFFLSTAGNILLIVIVVIVILIVIFKILQHNGTLLFTKKDKKIPSAIEDISEDEFIPDNWDHAIQQAIQSGNYRLALRHYYRWLLLQLQEKQILEYQISKTNYQYLYELMGTPLYKPFSSITRDYEYAWYGGMSINEMQFKHYQEQIKAFQNLIP
jgi:hypothetical protein